MKKTVSEFMDNRPICFYDNDSMSEIIRLMTNDNLTHAVIINKNEEVNGIISRKDVLDFLLQLTKDSGGAKYCELEIKNTPIKNVMTKTPIIVQDTDNMEDALEILDRNKFHCLPVINHDKKIVGTITFFDLLVGLMELTNPKLTNFYASNHYRNNTWMN